MSLCAFQNNSFPQKTKYEFTDTRVSQADTLLKNRQYQEALTAYQQAYDQYEAEEFYEGMVYAKERMGRSYRGLGKDSLSKVTYQSAARLSREKLGPNHILESKAYLNNGIRAHYNEKPVEASKLIDSSSWLYKRTAQYDPMLYRQIVEFKYYTYYYSNLSGDTLIKYLNERGKIYERDETSLEQRIFFISDYCRAYFKIGDFQKSVAYGLKAVRISESNLKKISPYYYKDALFNLGRSLWSLNNHEEALRVVNKLIRYTLDRTPSTIDLYGYYNLKALILSEKGDYSEAAEEFDNLITLLRSQSKNNTTYREATQRDAIMNLGVCYQLMGDFENAKRYLTKALDLEKQANSLFDTPFALRYRYLAQYFEGIGDYHNAFKYYDSALRNSVLSYNSAPLSYPSVDGLNITYENLIILKNKQINLEKLFFHGFQDSTAILSSSIEYAKKTHAYLIKNRAVLQANQGKLFLSDNFKSLYESAINSLFTLDSLGIEPNATRTAAEFFAFSKSILFLEQSGELGEVQNSRLKDETKMEYYKVKSDLERLEAAFFELINQVNTDDSLRKVGEELLRLDAKLKSFQNGIKKDLANDNNLLKSHNHTEIQNYLSHKGGRLLIEFFVGSRFTFVLGQTQNRTIFKKLELDSKFHENYKFIIDAISEVPGINSCDEFITQYDESANYLYSILLKPLFSSFEEPISDVVIIPDDYLAKIPFEALVNQTSPGSTSFSQLDYLILRYNIHYALSSKSLKLVPNIKRAKKAIMAIGYSTQGKSEGKGLPGTENEIKFLKENIPGDFLLGGLGSRKAFMERARDYDILHLAVHGKSDSTNRYESKLVFNDNNGIRTADLYIANLQARLAVLSACESGTGQINKGEGTFSIARGFAIVGVPSIVMSLWKVSDQISAVLMKDFYLGLADGYTVSESLRASKLKFLENADNITSHPFYWSSFVALGQDLNIEITNKKDRYKVKALLPVALVILALLAFVFIRYKALPKRGRV